MRYSCNRRGREDASADIWSQDGIATETTARCQLGKTCVCGSWIEPKRNRQILASSGLVQLKWPTAGILARFLPPSCTLRTITKHRENTQKFESCTSTTKPHVFPGKTRVRGRLWRLNGRLTEMFLGSKAAHTTMISTGAAPAGMDMHG